jgi:hypothetical protein
METEYTKGFRAGQAYEMQRIIEMLEGAELLLAGIDTGHGAGNELMSVRVTTIQRVIELIKGEK